MSVCFKSPLSELSDFPRIRRALRDEALPVAVSGCVDSEIMQLACDLSDPGRRTLLLTYNEIRAKELYEDALCFSTLLPQLYPARDLLFWGADVQGSLLSRQRMSILKDMMTGQGCLVITTADALLDRMISPAFLKTSVVVLTAGETHVMSELSRKLADLGYERREQVTMPGEFAVRGDILDIYPLTEENPVRVEFYDEEIDSIRYFNTETQRSLSNLQSIGIYPASESGDEAASLMDYLSSEDMLIIDEPARVMDRAEAVAREYQESSVRRLAAAGEKGEGLTIPTLHQPRDIERSLSRPHCLILCGLDYRNAPIAVCESYLLAARSLQSYAGHQELLIQDLNKWKREQYRIVLLSASRARAERLAHELQSDYELAAFCSEDPQQEILPGQILVTYGSIHKSFAYPGLKFAVLTESDLFGRRKARKKRSYSSSGRRLARMDELNVGDYVVHESYGLGRYQGIEQRIIDNIARDYLKISYLNDANLFVPITQLSSLEKYASADASPAPSLNRLGGKEWQNTKARVKKAVAGVAKDLVQLYAARQNAQGFCYSEDTLWQQEFEELFPYEPTEDQLKAIEAVKKDMESGKIMDRLICGDVGFGKTEIAIRAAFKAVQDSKQVVYLVPTTILAQQHYQTFVQRMGNYPINIGLLSRFRSPAEQRKVVEGLKNGSIDIVIGTHRLLSADVGFQDLGLLIIDEEQRFGVADKEKIKKLRQNVDVLSLTATPIPRTLHMSLIGIRDMSVLDEPPLDRVPIQTYVAEYNDEIVREAIARELARGGQVYYVSNRVRDIAEVASKIAELVPDAEVAFAHGQMKERELEQIMYDFVSGDIDVLVSTTIIETGLDIPNVNTIIIADSDRYGLSQLYQLRGRVGRSNRTAYAFLLYKGGRLLKDVAEKRLQAIRDYTELGSGVKISLRDLEIRGTGNLLGAEQHGHMEAVGYDMYCKMLGTAIRQIRGEAESISFDTQVDVAIDVNIPARYIPNESQKMDIYRRIADISCQADFEDIQDELIDRYGDIPRPLAHLLKVSLFKALAHQAYVTELSASFDGIRLKLLQEAPVDASAIPAFAEGFGNAIRVQGGNTPVLTLKLKPGEAVTDDALLDRTGAFVGAWLNAVTAAQAIAAAKKGEG